MSARRVVGLGLLAVLAVAPGAEAGRAADVRRQAYELLNEGVTAYKNGDYAAAVEKLRGSAAVALNSFRAHFYLGLALIADRRYADSIAVLEIALDLDPSHLQSLVAKGDAHLKLGDPDEANAAYFRALKLRPEYPEALDGLGRVFESQNRPESAVDLFLRAIAANRGFAPAYSHLGDLYLRLGRLEEAVRLLEEAVAVRPDFAAGLNRLALAYGRLGLTNEAIATIQRAMEIEPRAAEHPTTLGLLQLDRGALAAAEGSFRKSLALDPAYPEALGGLAEVARRRGAYAEALGYVDDALADPRLEAGRAVRLRELRERLLAERDEVTALEARARAGQASAADQARLAVLYARRGMWSEAVEIERGVAPSREQREMLAYLLFRDDRFREAHEIYAALAAESPGSTTLLNAGVSLAMLGDDRGAAAAFERALELEAGNTSARLYLANARLRLGEREAAAASYKAYLDAGGSGERAERVRRILLQIAPELVPPQPSPIDLPAAPQPPPPEPAEPEPRP